MNLIINILYAISLGIIISSEIKPLQQLKEFIGLGYDRKIFGEYLIMDLLLEYIHKLINCRSCLSFWIYLLTFNDFKMACIVYILSSLSGKII